MKNNLGCFRDDDGIEVLTVEFAEFLIRPDRICSYAAIPYFHDLDYGIPISSTSQHSTSQHQTWRGEVARKC